MCISLLCPCRERCWAGVAVGRGEVVVVGSLSCRQQPLCIQCLACPALCSALCTYAAGSEFFASALRGRSCSSGTSLQMRK